MVVVGGGFLWLAPILLLNLCFCPQFCGDRLSLAPHGVPPGRPDPRAVRGSGRAAGLGTAVPTTPGTAGALKISSERLKPKGWSLVGTFPFIPSCPHPQLGRGRADGGWGKHDGVLLPSCSQGCARQGWMRVGCLGKSCHLPHSPTCAALAVDTPWHPPQPPLARTLACTPAGYGHPLRAARLSASPVPQQGVRASKQMNANTPGAGLS